MCADRTARAVIVRCLSDEHCKRVCDVCTVEWKRSRKKFKVFEHYTLLKKLVARGRFYTVSKAERKHPTI